MSLKRVGLLLIASVFAFTSITACSGNANNSAGSNVPNQNQDSNGDDIVDIEVWGTNIGYQPVTKGSKLYELYKEKLGVGVLNPYVEWNGGTNYLNQLNLKIAANEMPDLFVPQQGLEDSLAKNGAIANLTELLPRYAPNVWEAIPEDIWKVVKANDPTGQGGSIIFPMWLSTADTLL